VNVQLATASVANDVSSPVDRIRQPTGMRAYYTAMAHPSGTGCVAPSALRDADIGVA